MFNEVQDILLGYASSVACPRDILDIDPVFFRDLPDDRRGPSPKTLLSTCMTVTGVKHHFC